MSMPGVTPSVPVAAQAAMQSGLANAQQDTAVTSAQPLIPVGSSDPWARTQEDQARAQAMIEAWQAYRGQLADPLKVAAGQPNDNVKTNRCAPIVDKGVSWLFGKPVTIRVASNSGTQTASATGEGDTSADAKTARAQDWLDGCLKANRLQARLQKAATNGAVCGHTFLMLHPDRPLANPQGQDYPRITLLDPATVSVRTAPDDVDLVQAYIIEYRVVSGSATGWRRKVIERVDLDGLAGKSVTGYDRDDTWRITDYTRAENGSFWVVNGQPSVWEYPFPPVADSQNLPNPNEYWGAADLTRDIVALNRVLNFIQSNTARIIKYHAHPKTWVKGARASQIDIGVDGLIGLPSVDASLQNLEMQSDLQSSMAFATDLRASMDELSRVPGVALGRLEDLPKGAVSGTTMRMLFEALTEKTESKRLLYGGMLEDLCMRLLWIAGFGEGIELELHWPDLLPVDDLLAAQAAVQYQTVGVPQKVIWEYLGFNPDVLADAAADEQQQQLQAVYQGKALPPASAAMPPLYPSATPGQPAPPPVAPGTSAAQASAAAPNQPPPVNHPAAIQARQAAQAAAGKRVTPTGM